ncbi:MAG: M16 family metallopeptidase [Gemmataceae bacterium]
MNRYKRLPLVPSILLVWLGLLACSMPSVCFAAEGSAKKIASIEGITEYHLDNGLRVLLFPDPSVSTVTVNLTVLVGSRHEGYGETGMAHLLEHMVFKGTPTHPNVPKALRDHGAREFNGTTWVDRTNYFETMPATDENLEFGIRLEADRMVNSFIKREDLASEMTVVRNEFEAGENSPNNILSQRMMAVAYEWHNYGKSTIGNRSDIERVPVDNLRAFYKKYYQPDNALLVVAGKFEEAKALGFISKYFGVLKKPDRKLDTTYTEEPAQDGERNVILRRVGTVGVAGLLYHIPAAAHGDFPAIEVLANLLLDEPNGRLYKALVTTKKAARVSGNAFGWHDPGVVEVSAQLESGQSPEVARDALIETLEDLSNHPATQEEVDRAKRQIAKDITLTLTKTKNLAIQLSDWEAKGDWRLFFLFRDQVARVTPADVDRVASKYLKQTNRTTGLYIPSKEAMRAEIPATPPVEALVKNYQGSQDVATGEAFDPTPENIEQRLRRSELPSGIKVAALPKKTRGDMVTLQLVLRYGNEESLKGYATAATLLPALMSRGTKTHTRQQLNDEFDKLNARHSVAGGPGALSVSLEVKKSNLPAALKLIGEILREPSFPADELDIIKRQRRESLERGKTEPQMLAVQALQRKMMPHDPADVRYVPTIEESISRLDEVTVDKLRKLYTDQGGAQAGELVIIGDDSETTPMEVQNLLKDWKSSVAYRRIPDVAKTDISGERIVIETPDKANALFVAGHNLPLSDADADYPALKLGNYIFGEAPLASRVSNRVRGKEGLSYGAGAMLMAPPIDKAGRMMLFAICNPKNIDKVDKTIAEELEQMIKTGADETEFSEAKKAYLQSLKASRANDSALAGQLVQDMEANRTYAFHGEQEKKLSNLTLDEVNATFRKYIDPKRLIIIRAGDFKKKPEEQDKKPVKKDKKADK